MGLWTGLDRCELRAPLSSSGSYDAVLSRVAKLKLSAQWTILFMGLSPRNISVERVITSIVFAIQGFVAEELMARHAFLYLLAGLISFVCCAAIPSSRVLAAGDEVDIIVNKANPVNELSLADARKIFIGDKGSWPSAKNSTAWVCSACCSLSRPGLPVPGESHAWREASTT
jgi:hypothetical protein